MEQRTTTALVMNRDKSQLLTSICHIPVHAVVYRGYADAGRYRDGVWSSISTQHNDGVIT